MGSQRLALKPSGMSSLNFGIFGEIETASTRPGYIGKEKDGESQTGDNGARHYDELSGRFLSVDSLWGNFANQAQITLRIKMNIFDYSFSRLFMEIKIMKIQLFWLLSLLSNLNFLQAQSLTSISNSADVVKNIEVNRRNISKQYSFCECMYQFAKLDSIEFKDGSLAMYREMLDYGFLTVFRLDSFVHNFVVTIKSDTGEVFRDNPYPCNIASCLWLMNSEELEQLLDYLDRNEGVIPKNGDKKKRLRKSRK